MMPHLSGRLRKSLTAFKADARGGIITMAAVALPAVAVLAIGASELMAVAADKTHLQDAADAAALMGAHELSLPSSAEAATRAEGYALAAVIGLAARATVTAEATVEKGKESQELHLSLTSHRQSFFGNMLPPGGFLTRATAVATVKGGMPLCMIALEPGGKRELYVRDEARLRAPGCLVHANASIAADSSARIAAGFVQAVGTASGPITPAPAKGAEPIVDPLIHRDIPTTSCAVESDADDDGDDRDDEDKRDDRDDDGDERENEYALTLDQDTTLQPGVHCGATVVGRSTTLTLAPGVHFFAGGSLILQNSATLRGDDVVLVFAIDSTLKAKDDATVDLRGRRSGALAGLLLVGTRNNTKNFELFSSNVRRLEGVIYLPAAYLHVEGSKDVAGDSEWTITVTKGVLVRRGARLIINSAYGASAVPVPEGVGPVRSGAQLLR